MEHKIFGSIISATLSTTVMAVFLLAISCGAAHPGSTTAGSASPISGEQKGSLFFGGRAPAYVGGPFEVLGESISHPESSQVYVGQLTDNEKQHGIKTHTAAVYGSVIKDRSLNLETGVIALAGENPFVEATLVAPSQGGNYFEYMQALGEIIAATQKVRGGSQFVPHTAAPHPELDDTLRYLGYIQATLTSAPLEAVFIDQPREVKASGSYDIAVSSKAVEPRSLLLTFQCEDTLIASAQTMVQSGINKTSLKIDLPDDLPATCQGARFEVTLVTSPALAQSPSAVARFSRDVTLLPSNVIEHVYTRATTQLRDKACWFRLVYATTKDSVLQVALVGKEHPEKVMAEQQYLLAAGDNKSQEVLLMLPEQVKSQLTGYEKIIIKILSKEGKVLSEYNLYAANARA